MYVELEISALQRIKEYFRLGTGCLRWRLGTAFHAREPVVPNMGERPKIGFEWGNLIKEIAHKADGTTSTADLFIDCYS